MKVVVDGEESVSIEFPQPSFCIQAMLDVMACTTKSLDLVWSHERQKPACDRLDKHFLAGHDLPTPRSVHFLPDLYTELMRLWDKPYYARLHIFQHAAYADVEGVAVCGHTKMPPVERMLVSVSAFHLDALLSPSGLFGTFTEAVDEKFSEAKEWSAALQELYSLPSHVFI